MGNLTHTVSGDIASFRSAARVPIESLKCHFLPIQEGSGDPSPSNVRNISGWQSCDNYVNGKNIGRILKYSSTTLSRPVNATTVTNSYGTTISTIDYSLPDTSLIITQNGPSEENSAIYKNGYFCVQLPDLIFGQYYDFSFKITNITNNPFNKTLNDLTICVPSGTRKGPTQVIDNIVIYKNILFSQNLNNLYEKDFTIYNRGMSFTLSEFMVTPAGINDGVFESYCGSTIPITFPTLGKNKFDYNNANIINNKRLDDTGIEVSDASGSYCQLLIPVIPNTVYTLSGYTENNISKRLYYRDKNQNFIARSSAFGGVSYTFTTPNNCYYCQIQNREIANAGWGTVQLEIGDSATTYEPYSSNNTVYGGYVDIAKGELVAEYEYITDTWGNWGTVNDMGDGTELRYKKFTNPVLGNTAGTNVAYCNVAPGQYANENGNIHFYIVGNSYNCRIYLPSGTNTNLQIQAIGKLITPIVYPLTTQQLKTFLNYNNIWSNTNDITEVAYAIHDAALIQTTKHRIAAAEPHIETNNIVSFNTDMIAPIKKAIINFEPIQEGSGDPSLSNIRPIKGFDFIKTTYCPNNLFPRGSHTRIQNGITFTYYENGDVHIEGTATANAWVNVPSSMYFTITPGTYRLGGNKIGSNVSVYLVVSTSNGGDIGWYVSDETGSVRTLDFTDAVTRVQIAVSSGKTVNTTIHPYLILEEEYNKMKQIIIPLTQGKNLFNEEYPNLSANLQYLPYYVGDGAVIVSTDCPQNTNNYSNLFCIPGLVTTGASTGMTDIHANLYRTITPINGYITIVYRNVNGADPSQYHTMIERQMEGQTNPSTYEPFQYIYGGYVDLINGTIVQEWIKLAITTCTFWGTWDGTKGAFWYTTLSALNAPSKKENSGLGLCETLLSMVNIGDTWTSNGIAIYDNGIIRWIDLDHMTDSQTDYKTYLSENPIMICYKLRNPITYQLTPQILKSLRGKNNIWSNANGNIEVEYYTH